MPLRTFNVSGRLVDGAKPAARPVSRGAVLASRLFLLLTALVSVALVYATRNRADLADVRSWSLLTVLMAIGVAIVDAAGGAAEGRR